MPEPLLNIVVADGKYRIVQDADGHVRAFRHEEPWLDVTTTPGSRMILAMAYEIEELRSK